MGLARLPGWESTTQQLIQTHNLCVVRGLIAKNLQIWHNLCKSLCEVYILLIKIRKKIGVVKNDEN